jgi:protein-tyrosine-phosphatase
MNLASVEVGEWEEVVDPASGDQDAFHACAEELDGLIDQLVGLLR